MNIERLKVNVIRELYANYPEKGLGEQQVIDIINKVFDEFKEDDKPQLIDIVERYIEPWSI